MSFTWIPIYSEIANKVLAFESRQDELLDLLREMRSEGMKVILLNDRDAEGDPALRWRQPIRRHNGIKAICRALALIGGVTFLSSACCAAGTLIDSFSEGTFSLSAAGIRTDQSPINGAIVNYRHVTGSGLGDWRALLVPGSGYLDYDVQGIVPAGRPFGLDLRYTSGGGGFNLADYNALLLDFAGVSGSGRLKVTLDFLLDPSAVVEVPLTSAGALEVSFDTMGMTSVMAVGLRISVVPDSVPFSFRLNDVSVVPEPSALGLMLAAGLHVLRRKRL